MAFNAASIEINIGDHKFTKDLGNFSKTMLEKIKKSEVSCEINDKEHITIKDGDTVFKITTHIERISLLIIAPGQPHVCFTGTDRFASGYKKLEGLYESIREFYGTEESRLTEREKKAKEILLSKIK